ncbi:type IV pilus modification protein PilV [Pseudomonas sp.]|uniref:type IV pilus modification protein PilV n=1 Tax=Pseudomonas sp. TaxID=306 RepID=UPI003BB502A3
MGSLFFARNHRGFTLIEVMVSVLILAVGLLGVAGMHARIVNAQFDAYQRAQAMLLLEDMASRIHANPEDARDGSYGGSTVFGLSSKTCDNTASSVEDDTACWNEALRGVGISGSGGTSLGSMIGARGCIENISGGGTAPRVIRITVAWQGMTPTAAPAQTCGQNQFGDDSLRRAISLDVTLAYLGEV